MAARNFQGGSRACWQTRTAGRPRTRVAGRFRAVIQDGQEDRRALEPHFGAWVVCTERPGPFQIAGLGEHGTLLARLDIEPGGA